MKKLTITVLFFSLALVLTACGDKEHADNESYKGSTASPDIVPDPDGGAQSQGGAMEAVVD